MDAQHYLSARSIDRRNKHLHNDRLELKAHIELMNRMTQPII